jgi:hypothetical protein
MPRSNRRGSKNNNPEGRNQYSDWGVMEMARERPMAAAAAAAGAAAAGLFLWSKRSQISQQISNLSDQIGEWTDNMRSADSADMMDDTAGLTTTGRSGAGSRSASGISRSSSTASRNRGMSETGGGNASLGARSGGAGIRSNASSRGRAKGIPSTT